MNNLQIDIETFLQTKWKEFDICICCGKTIIAELIGENYLNWCCQGEQVGSECENHMKPHNPNICPFYLDKKYLDERNHQRLFIKELIISLMNNYIYANFVANSEVMKAIESIIPRLDIYSTVIKGVTIYTTKWKTILHH